MELPAAALRLKTLDEEILAGLSRRFIAFDTETTGMGGDAGRIVEIGAVLFEDGRPTDTFETLVFPGVPMNPYATAVNHITDDMLRCAPTEDEVYPAFLDFLGDAAAGGTILCAHNAAFDFSFLVNTLNRLWYRASMRYVDTLTLSRRYIRGLPNYKQGTVGEYLGLYNRDAHRALADAEVCGGILCEIIKRAGEQ